MRRNGFTLIELMIVVVIISILMAIAVPSYREYVERSERSQAMAELEAAAQAMERYRMVRFTYGNATAGTALTDTISSRSPRSGTIRYNISFPESPSATFRIDAVQVDGKEALAIDNQGQRCIKANATTCVFGTDPSWGASTSGH